MYFRLKPGLCTTCRYSNTNKHDVLYFTNTCSCVYFLDLVFLTGAGDFSAPSATFFGELLGRVTLAAAFLPLVVLTGVELFFGETDFLAARRPLGFGVSTLAGEAGLRPRFLGVSFSVSDVLTVAAGLRPRRLGVSDFAGGVLAGVAGFLPRFLAVPDRKSVV